MVSPCAIGYLPLARICLPLRAHNRRSRRVGESRQSWPSAHSWVTFACITKRAPKVGIVSAFKEIIELRKRAEEAGEAGDLGTRACETMSLQPFRYWDRDGLAAIAERRPRRISPVSPA